MARSSFSAAPVRSTAEIAAANLQLATIHLAGLRFPPRLGKAQPKHRHLPIAIVPAPCEAVIIRHSAKN